MKKKSMRDDDGEHQDKGLPILPLTDDLIRKVQGYDEPTSSVTLNGRRRRQLTKISKGIIHGEIHIRIKQHQITYIYRFVDDSSEEGSSVRDEHMKIVKRLCRDIDNGEIIMMIKMGMVVQITYAGIAYTCFDYRGDDDR